MSEWNDKIDEVDELIANGHHKQSMQEAGGLMELLLRHVYAQVTSQLSATDLQKLTTATAKISAGKPVGEMTLGQLVGVFREGKVFDLAEGLLKKKLPLLKGFDFNTFVTMRNSATHHGDTVTPEEATLFAAQLRMFLSSLNLLKTKPAPSAIDTTSAGSKKLVPWSEVVKLHPDVESGELAQSIYALDLGAVAANDKDYVPVYRDPDAFFAATYITKDLRRLLEEILSSLAGKGKFDRVLKLRQPFGGGKSHTLAALLHAARSRNSLNQHANCRTLPDPGQVRVAVFDGEKFTAVGGKEVGGGKTVNTMWGWLAWQLGPEAYAVMEKTDQDRVAPGGDEIQKMLKATGAPVLLLLDEVLKYLESAGAVVLGDSTLQRLTLNFLQNLTVEVSNTKNCAMVYSLQWSKDQAMGNIALLNTIDTLTSRVDQVREPVTGEEVLAVVKQRLLAQEPPPAVAKEVSGAYVGVVKGMLIANAETQSAKQAAEQEAIALNNRMQAAYPFHPSLFDIMTGRWTSLAFQRTRGALRFLASCLYAQKKAGNARPLLGPGEIPLQDHDVRQAMLKDLDPAQAYAPVLTHDITGPTARAKRIDDRLAKETPALSNVRPAIRLATAILAYSFGGLKRESDSDPLPPGVTETELLSACIGPDLDRVTATSVLGELRNTCLYLHFDGVKYCFKKEPNVTALIEEAEQEVARDSAGVRQRIKDLLEQNVGSSDAIIWPEKSDDIPKKEPQFLIGYLPLEFAERSLSDQETTAKGWLAKCGDAPRNYKNGIGLAIPDKKQLEPLRRAVRYVLAVERVKSRKSQHALTKDQLNQLEERRKTEEQATAAAIRQLYPAVWLPKLGASGSIDLDKVEIGGRPLQAQGVHQRIWELLTAVGAPKVHSSLTAKKAVERVRLGEAITAGEAPMMGTAVSNVLDAFFGVLEPPRISNAAVLRKAIASGVGSGLIGYTTGNPSMGADGKFTVSHEKVIVGKTISDDEVDFDTGFIMLPAAIPAPPAPPPADPTLPTPPGVMPPVAPPGPGPVSPGPAQTIRTAVAITMDATRDQVFKSFPAIANLAEKSDGGKISIRIEGANASGYDKSWLRNAVEEPLDEANIEGLKIE
jgi:uncharacterized protein